MSVPVTKFDFKTAVSDRRLVGLWRMLAGFRLAYLGAALRGTTCRAGFHTCH